VSFDSELPWLEFEWPKGCIVGSLTSPMVTLTGPKLFPEDASTGETNTGRSRNTLKFRHCFNRSRRCCCKRESHKIHNYDNDERFAMMPFQTARPIPECIYIPTIDAHSHGPSESFDRWCADDSSSSSASLSEPPIGKSQGPRFPSRCSIEIDSESRQRRHSSLGEGRSPPLRSKAFMTFDQQSRRRQIPR
jgi:hypothetical protein